MTLCIGLLSLGITVYEESIVMNGSEFLSRVYTLGTCAFRLQLNVVLSPFPLSNSLSLFLSALVVIRLSSGLRRFRWLWHKPKAPLGPAGVYEVSGFFVDNIRYYQDSKDGILYVFGWRNPEFSVVYVCR